MDLELNYLPDEMLLHIFAFITDLQDQYIVSLVCRRWRALIWKSIDILDKMLPKVFKFLSSLEDRKHVSLVCHRWNKVAFNTKYLRRVRLRLHGSAQLTTVMRPYQHLIIMCHTFSVSKTAEMLEMVKRMGPHLTHIFVLKPTRAIKYRYFTGPRLKLLTIAHTETM